MKARTEPPWCPRCGREIFGIGESEVNEMEINYEMLAEAIYEACRQEAVDSQRPIVPEAYANRAEAFRTQFLATIKRICQPGYQTSPEAEHDSWMRAYEEMGWTYGPVRDLEKKTHPDMVPFDVLPESERQKDAIFLACCAVGRSLVSQFLTATERVGELEKALKNVNRCHICGDQLSQVCDECDPRIAEAQNAQEAEARSSQESQALKRGG